MGYRLPLERSHQLSSASAVQSGALLYVYENETTTAVQLYSDRDTLSTAANPIAADSAGRFPVRYVAARSLLTLVCKTSDGTTLWSDDDIDPGLGATQALLVAGDTLTGPLIDAPRSDIAGASTTNLASATSNFVRVTGSGATITALGTLASGARFALQFAGANTLTHNATSLILPGGANITTAANDVAVFRSLGSGNWICESYNPATGLAAALYGLTSSVAELNILDGVLATATEINRACDVSTRGVAVGGTALSLTEAAHDGKTIRLDHTAAASTVTLPAATGSGARFKLIVTAVNTNNHLVKVPDASNVMRGVVTMLDNDSNAATAYAATGTDDTITLNGTTTGGQIGDWLEFEDIAANTWHVTGMLLVPAGSNVADPFSATV